MTTPATPTTPPAAAPAAPPAVTPAPAQVTPPAPAAPPATPPAPTSAIGGTDPATPPAEKPKEPAKASPIELKLPEGVELDGTLLDGFKATAAELGLDSPKAQKVLDQFVAAQTAQAKATEAALAKQDAEWVEAIKADPEIQFGGAKWPETKQAIDRAKAHFPDAKGAVELLNQAGLGNHPAVVRLFAAIGRSLKEDRIAGATTPPAQQDERPSDAAVFFPTS